jgi:hypothetical protein
LICDKAAGAKDLHVLPLGNGTVLWLCGLIGPMIDKTKIIDTVCERLKKLPVSHHLDLRTYKRNRSVIIVKTSEDDLLVIENGHFKERFHVKREKFRKSLKTLLKKEFPRSKKVRLYVMDKFVEEEAIRTKRKIL